MCARQAATERPLLDALDHTAAIEVPVICWEFIQSVQSPLQCLKGSSRSHWVFITIGVLFVIAVCW